MAKILPFGTSFQGKRTTGFGTVEPTEGGEGSEGPPADPRQTPDVGAPPAGSQQTAGDVVGRLERALDVARTATNRLVNLPAPGVVPAGIRRELLGSYVDLEQAIRTTADRLTAPGPNMDAQRDAEQIEVQTQNYTRAVEEALSQAGVSSAALPAKKPLWQRWQFWAALAAGGGAVYFGVRMWRGRGMRSTSRPVQLGRGTAGVAASRKIKKFGKR